MHFRFSGKSFQGKKPEIERNGRRVVAIAKRKKINDV